MKKKIFIRYILLVIVALLAYGDTLFLKYASDDRMIIFENDYTLQGDVKSVMTKDAFTGYFGEGEQLVAGGRYRPLSQLAFMAEYQIFGGKVSGNSDIFFDGALYLDLEICFHPGTNHYGGVLCGVGVNHLYL